MFSTSESVDACRRWLRELAPDVIVIETHYMAAYVPDDLFARAVFDTHNSETYRIATMAKTLGVSPRGLAARWQLPVVREYEADIAARSARVVVVSDGDRTFFELFAPGRVDVVPNGVDCSRIEARLVPPSNPTILFLGSLDYSPNVDALNVLVDDIAPLISRRDATIAVVGSNPRPAVFDAARRCSLAVSIAADVADTGPYWKGARCLVVPLRMGGGTRLKILESLAWGVPVVSTKLGCEGLELRDRRELLIADDAKDFAAAVDRLLDDHALGNTLAKRGRELVEARYDWTRLGELFDRSAEAVLRANATTR